MYEQFARFALLFGEEALEKLSGARVAVFGAGGVGGNVIEALARSGVGTIDIIDDDDFSISNLNRQVLSTMETIGRSKVEVARERVLAINPEAVVNIHKTFYLPDTREEFDFNCYDYVVDAIDTVSGKIALILQAKEAGCPVISSMGCGNKTDPTRLVIDDIYKTSVDPLARVMRRELKKRGVKSCKVLYSTEKALKPYEGAKEAPEGKRSVPGSTAFVPPAAGIMIAWQVVMDLLEFDPKKRYEEDEKRRQRERDNLQRKG
ncbi:MAG: tRNA threonylcarbamoyladenosine dehydratase [Lachnospiraceae bacterium]|nr:tRNA threonylcarbamoyladenosine dehydratase [Lachnospiraceae bacterium]